MRLFSVAIAIAHFQDGFRHPLLPSVTSSVGQAHGKPTKIVHECEIQHKEYPAYLIRMIFETLAIRRS